LRRSASIRNNCGTGPKIKVPNYGSTKHPNYGCGAVKLRAENPVAGNGIFGCGDGAPKIATKKRQRGQRPKSGKGAAGNPRRKALFGVVSETGGLRRLDGGGSRAQTEDPPPSHRTGLRHPSRERNFSMQRRRVQIRIFVLQRLTRRQGRTRKSPLFTGQMRVSPAEFDT
jgi:hypothetical protein